MAGVPVTAEMVTVPPTMAKARARASRSFFIGALPLQQLGQGSATAGVTVTIEMETAPPMTARASARAINIPSGFYPAIRGGSTARAHWVMRHEGDTSGT